MVKENRPRWNFKKKEHYEVWYITGNTKSEDGFWIRYTIDPAFDRARVWFAFFLNKGKPLGIIKNFSLSEFKVSESLRIGEVNELSNTFARGKIKVGNIEAEWDFTWSYGGIYKHLPQIAYRLPIGDTTVISPNINSKASGYIKIKKGGKTTKIELEDSPIDQTHLWGKKHAYAWVWGHCNAFEEDGFFEGITAVAERHGIVLPPITLFCLKTKSTDFCANSLFDILKNKSERFAGRTFFWKIESSKGKKKFKLISETDAGKFILAQYDDPDGEKVYCYNTEVGSVEIEVEEDGKKSSFPSNMFHIEFGMRQKLDVEVPTFIED